MKTTSFSAAFAAAAILLIGASAFAQTLPQVQTINGTNDRMQVVPNGSPSAQSVYAAPNQVTVTKGYVVNPSTNGTSYNYTFGNSTSRMIFDPGASGAGVTIVAAANPSDGAEQCLFSTANLLVTWSANTGQTINDAITTLAANAQACYLFASAQSAWVRSH